MNSRFVASFLVDVFGFGVSVKEFFRNAGMVKELNCQPNSLRQPKFHSALSD